MSQLKSENMLFRKLDTDSFKNFLKEFGVVVKLERKHELRLEVFPDLMRLLALDLVMTKQDPFREHLVERISVAPMLP